MAGAAIPGARVRATAGRPDRNRCKIRAENVFAAKSGTDALLSDREYHQNCGLPGNAAALGSSVGMYVAVWGTHWLLGGDINQIIKLLVMVMIGVLTYVGLSLVINKQGYREILGLFWNK